MNTAANTDPNTDPSTDPKRSGLPVRRVDVNSETKPFWDATAEGILLLPKCDSCSALIWYPRAFCPACSGTDISWVSSVGTGTIYSFSITRKGSGVWAEVSPYVIAYVDLDEGPRVLSNVVGCAVEEVSIGMSVRVVFDKTGEGPAVYRFTPA
jgi:uncharacterized protein